MYAHSHAPYNALRKSRGDMGALSSAFVIISLGVRVLVRAQHTAGSAN